MRWPSRETQSLCWLLYAFGIVEASHFAWPLMMEKEIARLSGDTKRKMNKDLYGF